MKKTVVAIAIFTAVLGSGLLWYSGQQSISGIGGWQTLNTSMEQAINADMTEQKSKASQANPSAVVDTKTTTPAAAKPSKSIDNNATNKGAVDSSEKEGTSTPVSEGRINVNTAEIKELMELPGIGAKKAQAILDYRNSQGPFKMVADLGKVKGIGPKMLEKLKPVVSF